MSSRRCLAWLVVLCACDDDTGIEDADLLSLSEPQRVELCERGEDDLRRMNQALGSVACTTSAREAQDCAAARATCIAQIVPLPADSCSTPEVRLQTYQVLMNNVALDPELAAAAPVITDFDVPNMPASCAVKVRGLIDCNDANVRLIEQGLQTFTCNDDNLFALSSVPDACVKVANEVAKCTGGT